jgi:hypothetical protein
MREVRIGDKMIKINGVTRKQFVDLDLKAKGFDFFDGVDPTVASETDGAHDAFIGAATGITDTGEYTPAEWNKLFLECIKETYGSRDEEKNLPQPGTDL